MAIVPCGVVHTLFFACAPSFEALSRLFVVYFNSGNTMNKTDKNIPRLERSIRADLKSKSCLSCLLCITLTPL